jgi:hypothetical protein
MAGRWMALAAALGAAAAARGGDGAPCELARADRARTSSASCLACHDGAAGRELGPSHPVEVDYGSAAAREPDRYVPAALLRADVPLVDGKVSCTSCHDGASPHAKRAVDPGRLCLACHQM